MGHKIVYCSDCGKSILEAEFEKGRASVVADRPFCADCRPPPPAPEPEKPSSVRLTPPSQRKIATARIPVSPSTTRRMGRPPSRVPLIAGGVVGGVGVLVLVVAALSSSGRSSPAPPPPPAPKTVPPAPAAPSGARAPGPVDPARAAEADRAMREEIERQKARKFEEFLAEIRKLAAEDRRLRKGHEIERMLKSAEETAGARLPEVRSLRDEVRRKIEENRVRMTFVGHWKLDEGTGRTAADAEGERPAGALEGGPSWTSGRLGGALSFDGKDDGVRIENADDLSPQAGPHGEMTLAAWVRIRERPSAEGQGRTPLAAKGGTGAFEYALYVLSDGRAGFALWTLAGQGHAELAGGSVALDRWHHVAGTYRRGRFARLYLDGTRVGEVTDLKGEIAAGPSPLFLGRRGDKQFLKGAVDDVRLYSRVLSEEELQALAAGR